MGKFYTINCSKATSGRGFGDPLSMFIDKADNEEIVFARLYEDDQEYLLTSSSGK